MNIHFLLWAGGTALVWDNRNWEFLLLISQHCCCFICITDKEWLIQANTSRSDWQLLLHCKEYWGSQHSYCVQRKRNKMPRDEPGGLGELCSLSGWLKLIEVVLTFMTLLIHRYIQWPWTKDIWFSLYFEVNYITLKQKMHFE